MVVTFPGVKKICVADPSLLQKSIVEAHMAMLPVTVLCDVSKVKFVGEPKLQVVSYSSASSFSEKSTLEFSSPEKLTLPSPSAWIVTLVSGKSYLIGTAERPFPVVECSFSSGEKTGEAAVYRYKISHVGAISAIPVIM